MRRLIITTTALSLACSAGKTDNSKNADASAAVNQDESAGAADGGSGGEQYTTVAANETHEVEVKGEIDVPDGDLIVSTPVPTSLWLQEGSASDYDLFCTTLGVERRGCAIPINAQTASRGTFSAVCPDLGAASVACYLRRGGKPSRTVVMTTTSDNKASFTNLGQGVLELAISSDGIGPKSTAGGSALDNVDAVVSAAGRQATALGKSFTGTWRITCLKDAPAGLDCDSLPPAEIYLAERELGGKRYVERWRSQQTYDACTQSGERLPFQASIAGKSLKVDLQSASRYEDYLDAFYGELPAPIRDGMLADLSKGVWTYRQLLSCQADVSSKLCKPLASGAYAGLSELQRGLLREATAEIAGGIAWNPSVCEQEAYDIRRCAYGGRDQVTGAISNECSLLDNYLADLSAEQQEGGRIIAAELPTGGFAGCSDATQRPSQRFCNSLARLLDSLGMQIDASGKLTAIDVEAAIPEQSEEYAAETWYAVAATWCPTANETLTASQDGAYLPLLRACRDEIAAKSKAEQLAAATNWLTPVVVIPRLCPNTAAAQIGAGPDSYAQAAIACRDELVAANLTTQRQLAQDTVAEHSPLCADRKFAKEQVAALSSRSCLPEAGYASGCDTAADQCTPSLECKAGPCTDAGGKVIAEPLGLQATMLLRTGIDGSFALQEFWDTQVPFQRYGTDPPTTCTTHRVIIANATSRGDNAFDSLDDMATAATCADGLPYPVADWNASFALGSWRYQRQ